MLKYLEGWSCNFNFVIIHYCDKQGKAMKCHRLLVLQGHYQVRDKKRLAYKGPLSTPLFLMNPDKYVV